MVIKNTAFFILIVACLQAKGQNYFRQVAIGGGVGITRAYAGTIVQNSNLAIHGNLSYYPRPYLSFAFEAQSGKLSGGSGNSNQNPKAFVNNYNAFLFTTNISLGLFLDPDQGLTQIASGLYLGTGIGLMSNDVVNVSLTTFQNTANHKNSNFILPIKAGYDLNVVKQDEIPVLKIIVSYNLNLTGNSLDGYYDTYEIHYKKFYSYTSISLIYAFRTGDLRCKHFD